MSIVHHALFGDVGGRHGVVACSRNIDPLVEAIRSRSDLAPDRPAHVSWTTYTAGIRIEDVFAVMRTAPAPEASRPGMVLTHAAFVPIEDLVVLDDLGMLLAALPGVPSREAALAPTRLEPSPPPTDLSANLHEALLTAVVTLGSSQPLGWIGPDGFEDAVRAVWSFLTPEERAGFSFSFAFSPKSVLTGTEEGIALVRTPRSVRDRWTSHTAIDPQNPPSVSPSPTVAALLGREGGEDVRAVLDALDLTRPPVKDHAALEVAASYLSAFERGEATPRAVQTLARAVGMLAPSPDQGAPLKLRIAMALADSTRAAEDVLGLRNLDLSSFPGGPDVLDRAATSWMNGALAGSMDRARSDAEVLRQGLQPDAPSEWSRSIEHALSRRLRSWKPGFAPPVWRWWGEDGSLVEEVIARARPAASAEQDLVGAAPDDLPHLDRLRASALRHGRLLLHAHAVSDETPTAEALVAQIAADPDVTNPAAFDHIAARISEEETVRAAVGAPDHEILVELAGDAARRRPQALSTLDASEAGWRIVWASAVKHGAGVWTGVPHPADQRDALLQHEDESTRALLTAIADTQFANLLDHPDRRHLWRRLPEHVRAQYVSTTADAWANRLRAGSDVEWTLESELASAIFDPDRNSALFDPAHPGAVRLAVRAFGQSSALDETAFIRWVQRLARGPRLSKSDAALLGSLIAQNHWKRAARAIYGKAEWDRPDLWDAVAQFPSLLSLLQWGFFQLKSGRHELSESDWWSMLEEAAVELLETASELEYVWEKAGGTVGDLRSSGTGKRRAKHAVSLVRKGKGVRAREFLNALQDEYSSNNHIELLVQLGRSVGVPSRTR